MQRKYKLLVCDIDGTLANGNGVISDVDLRVLREIHRAGIMISLSTGRAARGCQSILEKLPAENLHVFFDGALVCNSDQTKVIYSQPIEKGLLREICSLTDRYQLTLELFTKTHFFVEWQSPLAIVHSELLKFKCIVADFTEICTQEPVIMGCLVIPAAEENKLKSLFAEFGDKSGLRFSWTMNPARPDIRLVNITMNDVSKGRALVALCSYLGLKLGEVAAIGDGMNDLSLLETAGLAIAMQNAPSEIKAVADYVTSDIEHNGFAEAAHKFLL